MNRMLKADLYRIFKSKLSLITLILVVVFPLITTGLYTLINVALSFDDFSVTVLNANAIIRSAYSLSNNVGLVIPIFSGILICMDVTGGTLRNKVIAGNGRVTIYLSHLLSAVIFNVVSITIYVLATAGFGMLLLPFEAPDGAEAIRQIVFWIITGTTSFIYVATISTFFALTTKRVAPTIIFSLVVTVLLSFITSIVAFLDYENYRWVVYMIPTFTMSELSLSGFASFGISVLTVSMEEFIMGLVSFAFFGALNTVLGILLFMKQDLK
ncbi:MAG: hypothetical protein IK088_08830 [Lachnospiraceae bacterium]|nr:hypothetical protein [Lachnospiraceae bacterium]